MTNQLQELVLRIYDTVADEKVWPIVLDQLVHRLGAQGCILFEWKNEQGRSQLTTPFFSEYYSADGLTIYLQKCAHLEARDQDIIRAKTSVLDAIDLVDDGVIAKSKAELENQEHMKTLRRFGIFHRAAGVMNKDNRQLTMFSVQLNEARGPLTDAERHDLGHLLPHLAKALDLGTPIRRQLQASAGILAAIDHLSIGVCVLDARGCIVVANAEFQRQQDAYALFRTERDGGLRITDDKAAAQMHKLMAGAGEHGKFGARPRKEAIATDHDSFLCLELSPLFKSDDIGTKAFSGFILFSTDTSRPIKLDATPMRDAFGLTGAELSVVGAIGEGLTNNQIAEQRSRSVATINAQVKSVLAKSQCANRTQFVRMLMSFGATFMAKPG